MQQRAVLYDKGGDKHYNYASAFIKSMRGSDPDAALYWHLDDQYVGTTRSFHQQALDIATGAHLITIVDMQGNRLSRSFEVLGRETPE